MATAIKGSRFARALARRLHELQGDAPDEEFAARIGVGRTTYRNWKAGTHKISADKLASIARALNVTTDWLLGVEGAPKTPAGFRQERELRADLATHIRGEVLRHYGTELEPWLRDLLPDLVEAQSLLDNVTALAIEEMHDVIEYWRHRREAGRAFRALVDAQSKLSGKAAAQLREVSEHVLRLIEAAPPSHLKLFPHRPLRADLRARAKADAAKYHAGKWKPDPRDLQTLKLFEMLGLMEDAEGLDK